MDGTDKPSGLPAGRRKNPRRRRDGVAKGNTGAKADADAESPLARAARRKHGVQNAPLQVPPPAPDDYETPTSATGETPAPGDENPSPGAQNPTGGDTGGLAGAWKILDHLPWINKSRRSRKVRIGEKNEGRQFGALFLALLPVVIVVVLAGIFGFIALNPPKPRERTTPAVVEGGTSALWSVSGAREAASLGDKNSGSARTISAQAATAAMQRAGRLLSDPSAQHNAGVAAHQLGQPDAARAYYLRALSLTPGATRSVFNLAQLEFEEGNYSEAARLYGLLRNAKTKNRVIAYRAYLCGLLLGAPVPLDEAILTEEVPAGLFARAAGAWVSGDRAAAREFARRARALESKNANHFEADLLLVGYFDEQ